MERSVIKFDEAGTHSIAEVGSKNATIGEIYNYLVPKGLYVPGGFAVTISVFRQFMQHNNLEETLLQLMERLDRTSFSNLNETGTAARRLVMDAKFPRRPEQEITEAYAAYFPLYGDVAVRGSTFAQGYAHPFPEGLHESHLNIRGQLALIYAIKCCYASLYSNRAIKFRETHGIPHDSVFLSVGIQQMVRADTGCSGSGQSLHPVPGFPDAVRLTGNWGLGQNTTAATHDEYIIFKSTQNTELPTIRKTPGSKSRMTVYKDVSAGTNSTLTVITPPELREKFVLDDAGIHELRQIALLLETHFAHPVDFEWAKDGTGERFYVTGVRPLGTGNYTHAAAVQLQSSKKQDIA